MKDKKAAIGATMTWVVATIIILVVILLFVYASFALGAERGLFKVGVKPEGGELAYSSISSEQMLLALLETEVEGKEVRGYVSEKNYKDYLSILDKELKPIIEQLPGSSEGYAWSLIVF